MDDTRSVAGSIVAGSIVGSAVALPNGNVTGKETAKTWKKKLERIPDILANTKELFTFIIFGLYVVLGSWAFYLVQLYNNAQSFPTHEFYIGHCADTQNASFTRAFYFMSTVYSSIGYGDVVPCTWPGKVLTIIFACTGVPLTLYCLGLLGQILRRFADRIWRTVLKRRAATEQNHNASTAEESEDRFPLYVGITMTIFWIGVSTIYFHACIYNSEDIPPSWTYFDAFYFTVISLFTIGFGDYYPTSRNIDAITFSFTFVGLALVSMCIAIVQKRMEGHVKKITKMMMQQAYKAADKSYFDETETKALDKVIGNPRAPSPFQNRAPSAMSRPMSRCGDLTTRMILREWKRKSLVQTCSTQTMVADVGIQTSDFESQANFNPTAEGEVMVIKELDRSLMFSSPVEVRRRKSKEYFKSRKNKTYPLAEHSSICSTSTTSGTSGMPPRGRVVGHSLPV